MSRTREWARTQILQSADFMAIARDIQAIFRGYDHCMIGGLAVAYHANPPVTVDVDFLVDTGKDGLEMIKQTFEASGWEGFPLIFPTNMPGFPKRGLITRREFPFAAQADFLATGNDKFLKSVVSKSKLVEVQPELFIRIATAEDLIVMKTLAGRDKDVDDIIAIEQALKGKLDMDYIERTVEGLL